RAVRSDDADDATAREREGQSVDEHLVAIGLLEIGGDDDVVAEARGRRDLNLVLRDTLELIVARELLVFLDARFVLGLSRPRRHADPLELVRQGSLARGLRLLLDGEARLFLLEPPR